ncbi:MAG TPA: amidohydrolase family protein [Solirubrobacteraceae bacterium]|nr:amidohydrolase family protein [Solirubrobacteraceae bacterium]
MNVDVDSILRPWFQALMDEAGRPALFDAHTHIGCNDPDTFRQSPEELLTHLGSANARGLVFPMHEPDGYEAANDAVLEQAEASGGRLVALTRVNPHTPGAVDEARRCMDRGSAGIKLHPRAEGFGMDEPVVRELVALAHERKGVMLIHAGRGIPALGTNTVKYSREFPDARLILAHCAISDLAWLARELPEHPNVFIDTSWWHPSDILSCFCLAPPGQVLWASDSPYGRPLVSAIDVLRCALEANLTPQQIAGVFGGQVERLVTGQDPLDLGPPPGPPAPLDLLLERVVAHLTTAFGRVFAGGEPTESLGLARLAAGTGDAHPQADVFASILWLLDLLDEHMGPPPPGRAFPLAGYFLVASLVLARTPRAVLPPDLAGRSGADASHEHAERGSAL